LVITARCDHNEAQSNSAASVHLHRPCNVQHSQTVPSPLPLTPFVRQPASVFWPQARTAAGTLANLAREAAGSSIPATPGTVFHFPLRTGTNSLLRRRSSISPAEVEPMPAVGTSVKQVDYRHGCPTYSSALPLSCNPKRKGKSPADLPRLLLGISESCVSSPSDAT
jgi:hypothetical protein